MTHVSAHAPYKDGGINARARLIDEVHRRGLAEREDDSDALELTTREGLDVLVEDGLEVHRLHDVRIELGVHERGLDALQEEHADRAREGR